MSVIGVDMGGSKTLAVRLEGDEVVAREHEEPEDIDDTIQAIASAVESVADGTETAIGVGMSSRRASAIRRSDAKEPPSM